MLKLKEINIFNTACPSAAIRVQDWTACMLPSLFFYLSVASKLKCSGGPGHGPWVGCCNNDPSCGRQKIYTPRMKNLCDAAPAKR